MTGMVEGGAVARLQLLPFLARRELQRRYAGSLLGWWWALLFPAFQLAVYFAVLTFGLGVTSYAGYSLAIALLTAMLPWPFLTEALVNMTQSLASNSALIRNSALPVSLFPQASLLAALVTHGGMAVAVVAGLALAGYPPTIALFSLPYALICACALLLSVGSLLAIANAAFRDVSQALMPMLTLWFWLTPITWPETSLPDRFEWLLHLNPVWHVIKSYRHALLGDMAAAPGAAEIMSFWAIILVLALLAVIALRGFKHQLADTL